MSDEVLLLARANARVAKVGAVALKTLDAVVDDAWRTRDAAVNGRLPFVIRDCLENAISYPGASVDVGDAANVGEGAGRCGGEY